MYSAPNTEISFEDWGAIAYEQAWALQKEYLQQIVALKTAARDQDAQAHTPNYLFFCEHPHVYTLGKSGDADNLLLPKAELEARGASFYHIERGGDITYHGPGQLVGYPVIDLENFMTDLGRYLRGIEEAIIRTLATYGIVADRYPGYTGVWIAPDTPAARKIAAIGIKCSRWVAMHGFALNVNTDLSFFNHIVPCGISDKGVTSLQVELGREVDIQEVESLLRKYFSEVFGIRYEENIP